LLQFTLDRLYVLGAPPHVALAGSADRTLIALPCDREGIAHIARDIVQKRFAYKQFVFCVLRDSER
jgi:hypothetical protein